ncbi:MAG: cytochrome C [Pseudomonadota bacterium]
MRLFKKTMYLWSILLMIAMQNTYAANSFDQTYLHPAIPLLDEAGNHVLNSGNAYSSKTSCGSSSCHDYESITKAYHFQMGRDEASDDYGAKHGVPQLVSPGYFGGYACMGGSRPEILAKKNNSSEHDFMDKGSAGLVQRCATCHTGGGWMEQDREGIRYDQKNVAAITPLDGDYYTRVSSSSGHGASTVERWDWKKSGVVEADCMMCHADFTAFKKFPASGVGADTDDGADSSFDFWKTLRVDKLIKEDFFREANTAFWEFYNIAPDTAAGKQLVSFSRTIKAGKEGQEDGYDLNLSATGKPRMNWNTAAFDGNKKVVIPMLRFPGNDNCMACHRTSNSRRGFYGFGDSATMTLDEDGVVEEDYQDDVHKGKTWTADNGEVRQIENCNTCHSTNYLNPSYANMDLSVSHNFLKGNSDMDVRNDLDYDNNAKSCEYCHEQSQNPVIPSGHGSMQTAHKELWKANGDMLGYSSSSLDRITQTHLDVISCQACHITNKKSRGKAIQIMYRYRQAEDGRSKIIPYNPRIRHYWKDKNSNRVLSREEYLSVYSSKTDASGELYGVIIDPVSGEELAIVTASSGRHGVSYGAPKNYADFVQLKTAYDKLMQSKGHKNTNMQQIWIESNEYIMTHNVRSSADSLQCETCHAKKQSGSFSSLISPDSIFGASSVKTVTELPDKRLVDDGYIVLGLDYFKVDGQGVVTENVDDILYSTKVNPFMSILKASNAIVNNGQFKTTSLASAMTELNINSTLVKATIDNGSGSDKVYLYNTHQGDKALKNSGMVVFAYGSVDAIFPTYRAQAEVYNSISADVLKRLNDVLPGASVASSIYRFQVIDKNNQLVTSFSEKIYIKIAYSGTASSVDNIAILSLADGSATIKPLDKANILSIQPQSELSDGYIMFSVDTLGYFVAMEQ